MFVSDSGSGQTNMIGVVLWSDADGKSAVFWCEDQGDLAYYERKEEPSVSGRLFAVGDMVAFGLTHEGRLRRAQDPQLLVSRVGQDLPSKLRQTAQRRNTSEIATKSGEVVAFPCQDRSRGTSLAPRSRHLG